MFNLRQIHTDDYGCSFIAKLSWKKKCFFFEKIFVFFTKYTLFAEKCFYMEKNFFYWEKYKWKCKNIYLISEIYFYRQNVCVTNKT